MQVFDLDAEVFYGSTDWKPPTIEEAQKLAGTQGEDQDEDPYTSPEELARITRILGFDPDELNDDWEEEEEDVEAVKHLPGQHNQMSHGGGSMAADTGGNTSGGGGLAPDTGQSASGMETYQGEAGSDKRAIEVAARFNATRDLYGGRRAIPEGLKAKTGASSPDKGLENNLCYSNALQVAKESGLPLFAGYYIDNSVAKRMLDGETNYINFSFHAWNEKDGKVHDTTFGKNRGTYIGAKIDPSNLEDGRAVREAMFSIMGID